MKNLIELKSKILKLSVILFCTHYIGYAEAQPVSEISEENDPVSIYVTTNGNLKIIIDNEDTQKYKISIVDKAQKVWFEENTYKKVYRKTFDFNHNFEEMYEVVVSGPVKSFKFKLKRADEVKYSLVPIS